MHAERIRYVKQSLCGSKGRKKLHLDSECLRRTLWWVPVGLWAEGATMPWAYAAVHPAHRPAVSPQEVHHTLLDRDDLWDLVDISECFHTPA